MKRALFVYAKLNPGIKYVQGMNEIYAPIYHQFATDPDAAAAQHAEADAFFCFVELVSEFRDHFCQHLVSQKESSHDNFLILSHNALLWSFSCKLVLYASVQANYA